MRSDWVCRGNSATRLYGMGLIHRLGEFVWASRAAIHADEIAV